MQLHFADRVWKFFKKYFLEGQKLQWEVKEQALTPLWMPWEEKLIFKSKRLFGFMVPGIIAHLIWWPLAIRYNFFALFPTQWPMSVTMIFGSLIAGMTSEGGGAVAFPVMTLILKIKPSIARDFTFAIQSCGMTAASFTILWMGIQIEWHSLIYCTIGSTTGLIIGLEFLSPVLKPAWKKMAFVGISTSFAVALYILNREKKRRTFDWVQNLNAWRVGVLLLTGFIGGFFTSFLGSGSDLCSFVTLTLLFLVSEKVATPTSVVIMAVQSLIGFFWRQFMMDGIATAAWQYLAVAAPIVVIGAPLGSLLASHFHRQVLAVFIYILEFASFVTGFAVVKPSAGLAIVTLSILFLGSFLFWCMSIWGRKLHGFYNPQTECCCQIAAWCKRRRAGNNQSDQPQQSLENGASSTAAVAGRGNDVIPRVEVIDPDDHEMSKGRDIRMTQPKHNLSNVMYSKSQAQNDDSPIPV